MNSNNASTESVHWDLSLMYAGLDDPRLEADILTLSEMAKNFNLTHKGKLAENLGKAITDYAEIHMLESKIMVYLYLKQSTNVADAAVKSKIAHVERVISEIEGEYLTFFGIELVGLDESVLVKLYESDPVVKRHRPWIEHKRIFKKHLLTEPVEAALTKRSPFGPGAWSEFFDELEADLDFEFRGEKRTLTEIIHLLTESKDKDKRLELMKIMNTGLGGAFAKYSAQTLYMIAGSGGVENKARIYLHPMESRNKSSQIPDAVVANLHKAVKDTAGSLARRYYKLKAAHLGLQTLKWSDRNAPMPFADTTTVPFEKAMEIVLTAYESFSPILAGLIRDCVEAKHIDAPATKGKRGGAFNCSIVLPGGRPASFIFLNYLGSNRDVMTLAHELGHAGHGLLAGETQGALMFQAPIAYCETASVFGEMTTFNFLKQQLIARGDQKSLLALIMERIDDTINTTVRQIGFSNFERRLHGMDPSYQQWNEPQKLSVEELGKIWLETLRELYGEGGEVFTYEETDHLWAYISHFHNPFYVYGYAFGQFLTCSLYAEQYRIGRDFEPLYLDLLRSGSTKGVVELLKPFALDPADENFWANGVKVSLGAMVEEAENLSRGIGLFF